MPLILKGDRKKPPTWSIDAVYSVHGDCKSHTGASFTMGAGSVFTVSCKQKVNTKSSTEAELVAVDDCIGHVLRIRHFLLAQGYAAAETVVILQDNQSAILLEQNGIMSSTKRTKHLNVRYFFCKSKIDAKELVVVWCSTDLLVGDFFSKPLTGAKFEQFRQKIMNYSQGVWKPAMHCFHQMQLSPREALQIREREGGNSTRAVPWVKHYNYILPN